MARNRSENIDPWDKLVQSCPLLFAEADSFHFECAKGWLGLLTKLCLTIEAILKGMPAGDLYYTLDNTPEATVYRTFEVAQVKEKFGTLRFYMDGSSDEVDVLIGAAVLESSETGEKCGEPGTLRANVWFKTLCDEHDRLRNETYDLEEKERAARRAAKLAEKE